MNQVRGGAFLSWSCCNKLPLTRALKTTVTHCLKVLQTRGLKSRCQQSHVLFLFRGFQGGSGPASFSFWWLGLACSGVRLCPSKCQGQHLRICFLLIISCDIYQISLCHPLIGGDVIALRPTQITQQKLPVSRSSPGFHPSPFTGLPFKVSYLSQASHLWGTVFTPLQVVST